MATSRTQTFRLSRLAGDVLVVLLDIVLLAIGLAAPIATLFVAGAIRQRIHGFTHASDWRWFVWFELLACVVVTTIGLIGLSRSARKPVLAISAAFGAILALLLMGLFYWLTHLNWPT